MLLCTGRARGAASQPVAASAPARRPGGKMKSKHFCTTVAVLGKPLSWPISEVLLGADDALSLIHI